jgi:hypothetical protein
LKRTYDIILAGIVILLADLAADILGEGDEVMVEPVASSFLTKKASMFLNSAARELSGITLASVASTAIVRRRVPDLSVSQVVPTE